MSNLIRIIKVPSSLKASNPNKNSVSERKRFYKLKIYPDKLIAKHNEIEESEWFFANYIGVEMTHASFKHSNAYIVFTTDVTSRNYSKASSIEMIIDPKRIAFSSGSFSYAGANQFTKELLDEIRIVFNKYHNDLNKEKYLQEQEIFGGKEIKTKSIEEKLLELKNLLNKELISDEDYEKKKTEILDRL